MPTVKSIRPDVRTAMTAALNTNLGYIWRGHDKRSGAQAGNGTLLMLERRGWARLVRAMITDTSGRLRLQVLGGWITRAGRSALRDTIIDNRLPMPARLTLPGETPGDVITRIDRYKSIAHLMDPFELLATVGVPGRDTDRLLAEAGIS
jgi:hypothetical protein